MLLLYNPRCSKCRQAVAFLQSHGVEHSLRDYIKNPLSLNELYQLKERLGLEPKDWMRRVVGATSDEQLQAMVAEPELLQRPIAVAGEKAWVVRNPEALRKLLAEDISG